MQDVKFSQLAGFSEKQLAASRVSDEHQFMLYGGSRGPGKSYWLRWDLLRELLKLGAQGIHNAVAGLFCEDYPVLRDRQISKIEAEFPSWMGTLKDSKANGLGFHLKEAFGGGVLTLRNLDDPSKFQSAEFAAIGVDELTKHEVRTFNVLRGSLRWPGVPQPRFKAATNPGSIGHQWVRDYFIDGILPEELEPLRHEFAFVKALPIDNPHLSPQYWAMLNTLPPALAKAWVDGDWDVIEGAFFEEWRKMAHDGTPWHVVPTTECPKGLQYYIGGDYGYAKPWACYLVGFDCNGRALVCRELYETERKASEQAGDICDLIEQSGVPKNILFHAPHDIFAKQRGAEGQQEPIVEIYRRVFRERGFGIGCVESGRDPLARANRWREYLSDWGASEAWPNGQPGLQVMECCKNLIRTLPLLTPDEHKPEQVDTDLEDHAYDAVGHILTARPGRAPKKRESERVGGRTVRGQRTRQKQFATKESQEYR